MTTSKKKSRKRSSATRRPTTSDLQNISTERRSSSSENDMNQSQAAKLVKEIEDRKEALLQVVEANRKSRQAFDLVSILDKLTDEDLDKMWTSCQLYTTEAILHILGPGSASQDVFDSAVADTKNAYTLISAVITLARSSLGLFVKSTPEQTTPPRQVSDDLTKTVSVLHDFMTSLPASDSDQIKNSISKLCEEWYCKGLPEKDSVVPNVMIHLLNKSLVKSKATKADVKRVFALHLSLVAINLNSSSNEKVKEILLATAKSHLFLKCNEGIKLISFLFSLSPSFIGSLHSSIKLAIPGLNKELAKAYGEVYYKAWTNSAGIFRQRIEEDCIQFFMYHGVLANRSLAKSQQIFEPIFHILERFTEERNCRETQALLERLWEPILWRHLRVASEMVRGNATIFFLAAYPIENPNEELETRGAKQEQQIEMMLQLLDDDAPEVRILAIDGVCKILARLWIILSSVEINRLVKVLVHDLACDASSPQVRQAVLKGLKLLVTDCPRSHLYLREILPRLKDRLHDVSEGVRISMMDILLSVKKIRAIKFWDICPLEDLLDRMAADDSAKIYAKITQLLFPSFFPVDQVEDAKIERCIVMVGKNRIASRIFYQYIDKLSSVHDSIAFILAILVNIKRFVKYKLSQRDVSAVDVGEHNCSAVDACADHELDREDGDKENEGSNLQVIRYQHNRSSKKCKVIDAGGDANSDLKNASHPANSSLRFDSSDIQGNRSLLSEGTFADSFSDPTIVTSLLDIVCIIWVSRSKDIAKPENKEYRVLLEKKAAGILSVLFKYYKCDSVCRPVIYMCSFLPQSSVPTVVSFCLSRIRNATLPDEACAVMPLWSAKGKKAEKLFEDDDPQTTYIDSLCNWNRSDDILEIIFDWIQKDIEVRQIEFDGPARRSSRKTHGVRFAESADLPRPKLALIILKYILRHPLNKSIVMRKNFQQIEDITELLKAYVPIIEKFLQRELTTENEDSELILAHAWDTMLKLNFLLHFDKIDSSVVTNDSTLDSDVMPTGFLTLVERLFAWVLDEVIVQVHGSRLARSIVTSLLHLTSNLVTLNLVSATFVTNAMEVAMRLLETVGDLACIKATSSFCCDVAKWSAISDDPNVGIVYSVALPDLTRTFISRLPAVDSSQGTILQEVKKNLQVILVTYKVEFYGPLLARDLLRPILEQVLKDLTFNKQREEICVKYDSIKELPFLSEFLMEVVTSQASILLAFLGEWKDSHLHPEDQTLLQSDLLAQICLLRTLARLKLNTAHRSELIKILMVLEMKLENLPNEESEDIMEGNQVEDVALEVIKEAKISLQMITVDKS